MVTEVGALHFASLCHLNQIEVVMMILTSAKEMIKQWKKLLELKK
jgi:hypothetical protein